MALAAALSVAVARHGVEALERALERAVDELTPPNPAVTSTNARRARVRADRDGSRVTPHALAALSRLYGGGVRGEHS